MSSLKINIFTQYTRTRAFFISIYLPALFGLISPYHFNFCHLARARAHNVRAQAQKAYVIWADRLKPLSPCLRPLLIMILSDVCRLQRKLLRARARSNGPLLFTNSMAILIKRPFLCCKNII